MLKRLVKTVRRQPKPVRNNIAVALAGLFTAAVFVVWLHNMPARNTFLAEEQFESGSAGFSHMFSQVGNQLSSIKDSVSKEIITEEDSEQEVEVSEKTYTEEEKASWSLPGGSDSAPVTVATSTSDTEVKESLLKTGELKIQEPKSQATDPSVPRVVRIISVPEDSSASSGTTTEQ